MRHIILFAILRVLPSLLAAIVVVLHVAALSAIEPTENSWQYSEALLTPFWQGGVMHGESVLFVRQADADEAKAKVMFPIEEVVAVEHPSGTIKYVEGQDYNWNRQSREITLPKGSRIVSTTLEELRRPARSQQFSLPHRDGKGDILFGDRLQYQDLQTCITYRHRGDEWKSKPQGMDEVGLAQTLAKLRSGKPLRIVVIGDSISTGCNASGWASAPPYQPAYPELVRLILQKQFGSDVSLTNLSVGGMSTPWALTMLDQVVAEKPDLVIFAFGMNDSSGRPANEFQANTKKAIDAIRSKLPDAEFILVATMVGNPAWISLKQELFPAYRDALLALRAPGVAVADVTSVWLEILRLKSDRDQTGNGVNHPNDFGHRIYAQVIASLLVPPASVANQAR